VAANLPGLLGFTSWRAPTRRSRPGDAPHPFETNPDADLMHGRIEMVYAEAPFAGPEAVLK
jgi:hypothetical protein